VKEFLDKGGLDNILSLLKTNPQAALKIMAKSARTILVIKFSFVLKNTAKAREHNFFARIFKRGS
jgi:hypothetical protein